MRAVETLRDSAWALSNLGPGVPLLVRDGCRRIAVRLDALAAQLAHVDPAVLDLAAVVAADVAAKPLPDGWTAVVTEWSSVIVFDGTIVPRRVPRVAGAWCWGYGDHAHLADVVAAVTGGAL